MVGTLDSLMRSIGAAVTVNVPWYDIPGAIDLILRREKEILDGTRLQCRSATSRHRRFRRHSLTVGNTL